MHSRTVAGATSVCKGRVPEYGPYQQGSHLEVIGSCSTLTRTEELLQMLCYCYKLLHAEFFMSYFAWPCMSFLPLFFSCGQ